MSLNSRTNVFMCRANGSTTYLYPKADIQAALQTTTHPYTFDETNLVCPTLTALIGVYSDIFAQTIVSQPIGNQGFSCNAGTLLEDLGEDMQFMLPNGEVIVRWRLVRQITPQANPPLGSPGNSPNGTVGFATVFCAYGRDASSQTGTVIDPPSVIRLG
jgi:hypothetical protein